MNIEKIKSLIAEAIANRTDPPIKQARAKYVLWINTVTQQIGCGWVPMTRFQTWQKPIYTFIRDPNDGFTAEEWTTITKLFEPYFK